jgi:outer membrane murein-binding lipoprotein Lpp
MRPDNPDIENSGNNGNSFDNDPSAVMVGPPSRSPMAMGSPGGYSRLEVDNGSISAPPRTSKFAMFARFSTVLALLGAVGMMFIVLKQRIDVLSTQYDELNVNFVRLQSQMKDMSTNVEFLRVRDAESQNVTLSLVDARFQHADIMIANLTQQVSVISNHSNAQVLQQLQQTKVDMNNNLQQTQVKIEKDMNSTIRRMNAVVLTATETIFNVQDNVTAELTAMSYNMQKTIDNLNTDVQLAENNINDQVSSIQNRINTYIVVSDKLFAAENDFVRFQLAGTFTLIGCLISLWHINSHGRHYINPNVQRRVMAVLWMVPIYSVTSWLSLVFPAAEYIFGTIRDIYESYVVYTFIGLLIAVLEEDKGLAYLIHRLREHIISERIADEEAIAAGTKRPTMHLVPTCARFSCMYDPHRPSSVAEYWLYQCRLMVMQFVFLKPIFALLPSILKLSGYNYDQQFAFHDGHINWASAKIYIIFLENISVGMAFYGLLTFYHGTEKELAWCEPWPKFLCIKGVVFMTFWQGFFITVST